MPVRKAMRPVRMLYRVVGTNSRWTVGIGKAHALSCELVQVGRRDLGLGIVAAYVAIAQVIGQNE